MNSTFPQEIPWRYNAVCVEFGTNHGFKHALWVLKYIEKGGSPHLVLITHHVYSYLAALLLKGSESRPIRE